MTYILFDLDGTLTDPKIGITTCISYALNHMGIEEDDIEKLCSFIGPPLADTFKIEYNFAETQVDLAIAKYRERFAVKGIYENIIYDGIPELLEKLNKNGKKIILATSKPAVFAKKILEYFKIDMYFDFVSGSELDGTRNHKDEVIAYALINNNITDMDDVVMVGDRKYDVIGAQTHGIKTIGVLYGYGNLEELKTAGANTIVNTVEELSEILLNQ